MQSQIKCQFNEIFNTKMDSPFWIFSYILLEYFVYFSEYFAGREQYFPYIKIRYRHFIKFLSLAVKPEILSQDIIGSKYKCLLYVFMNFICQALNIYISHRLPWHPKIYHILNMKEPLENWKKFFIFIFFMWILNLALFLN